MIDFSVQLIENSLKLCYSMHNETKKRLYSEQERCKKVKNQLQQAKNNAIQDKRLAEKERDLCQSIYNKNINLLNKLKYEKTVLEETLNNQKMNLAQLKAYLSTIKQMSTDDQEVDTSSIESQIASLETQIKHNEERIKYLNNKISQIEVANAKLIQKKSMISQMIVKLGEYITKCQQSEKFLTSSFDAFYQKAHAFLGILDYCETKIKSAQYCAQNTNDDLTIICSRHSGFWSQKPRIVVERIDEVESLSNDWNRMCIRLNDCSDILMKYTKKYRKSIQDSVSKDVVKIASSINNNLNEIYELLNYNAKKTSEFEWHLKDYLKCKC